MKSFKQEVLIWPGAQHKMPTSNEPGLCLRHSYKEKRNSQAKDLPGVWGWQQAMGSTSEWEVQELQRRDVPHVFEGSGADETVPGDLGPLSESTGTKQG